MTYYHDQVKLCKTLRCMWSVMHEVTRDQDYVQLHIRGVLGSMEHDQETEDVMNAIEHANWITLRLSDQRGRWGVAYERSGLKEKWDMLCGLRWKIP